jgi:hypothetical protein
MLISSEAILAADGNLILRFSCFYRALPVSPSDKIVAKLASLGIVSGISNGSNGRARLEAVLTDPVGDRLIMCDQPPSRRRARSITELTPTCPTACSSGEFWLHPSIP